MVYRATNSAVAVDDIREEYGLSPERSSHVAWLINDGVLNPSDVRTLLSRHAVANLRERHGDDVNEWPPLSAVTPPPSAKRGQANPVVPASHRGAGAIPAERKARATNDTTPDVVVLDWGLGRPEHTPPPPRAPRARTTSPMGTRYVDLREYFEHKRSDDVADPLQALAGFRQQEFCNAYPQLC